MLCLEGAFGVFFLSVLHNIVLSFITHVHSLYIISSVLFITEEFLVSVYSSGGASRRSVFIYFFEEILGYKSSSSGGSSDVASVLREGTQYLSVCGGLYCTSRTRTARTVVCQKQFSLKFSIQFISHNKKPTQTQYGY